MSDQRQNIRCAVPIDQEAAELRLGRRYFPARLVDQSSSGFGVLIDDVTSNGLDVEIGQSAVLGSVAGWSRVRVVHRVDEGGSIRLGLERVSDLPGNYDAGSPAGWMLDSVKRRSPGLGWRAYLPGLLIVVACAMALVVCQYLPSGEVHKLHAPDIDYTAFRERGGQTFDADPNYSRAEGIQPIVSLRPGAEANTVTGASSMDRFSEATSHHLAKIAHGAGQALGDLGAEEALASASDLASDVTDSVNDLGDALRLQLPAVAGQLKLSEAQRRQLDEIWESVRTATEELIRSAVDKNAPELWAEVSRLRRAANEQALAALTPEQRELLARLK